MVDPPEYNLAKYLDNVIKPYIPDTHLLRSTEDFLERLKQFPCNDKCVLSQVYTCTTFGHDFVVASRAIFGARTGRLPHCSRLVQEQFKNACSSLHDEFTHSSRIVYALRAVARRVGAI